MPDLFEETSLPNQGQSLLSVNPSRKFTVLSNCAYYPGAKPGKKHALNNQYAPNSELRLLTRVYGIVIVADTSAIDTSFIHLLYQ